MSTEHTMEEATGITTQHTTMEEEVPVDKGKGKALQEHTEGEEDSSDDDDMAEDAVSICHPRIAVQIMLIDLT